MEWPKITFKNMVHAQLISCGHEDKLWCFWYQYIFFIVFHLVNYHICNSPIIPWFKVKYKIKFWYIFNSRAGNKSLDIRTSTYPRTVLGPLINDNLLFQYGGYFMGCSNTTYFLDYYYLHTHRVKRSHHGYVSENDIQIHPK